MKARIFLAVGALALSACSAMTNENVIEAPPEIVQILSDARPDTPTLDIMQAHAPLDVHALCVTPAPTVACSPANIDALVRSVEAESRGVNSNTGPAEVGADTSTLVAVRAGESRGVPLDAMRAKASMLEPDAFDDDGGCAACVPAETSVAKREPDCMYDVGPVRVEVYHPQIASLEPARFMPARR